MSLKGIAAALICLWVLVAVLGPEAWRSGHVLDLGHVLDGPAKQEWLGYDELGRSLAGRMAAGARISLLISASVVLITAAIGTAVGIIAGYFRGVVDRVTMLVVDILLAFPGLLLAIVLAALLGPGVSNVIIALAATGWVGFARVARAQTLAAGSRGYVQAAVAMGVGRSKIMLSHLLPFVVAPITVEATFSMANAIIAEAGLSFLGIGVHPPAASWGSIIREGTRYLLVAPHLVLFPASAMVLVVLSVNVAGDWLRDRLDVRRIVSSRNRPMANIDGKWV